MNYPAPPAREILWETISKKSGVNYIVTSNQNRDKYHLYSVDNGKLSKRIGTASTPELLKNKFIKE